jgi:tetratricopeptide (TPR) repeat protein
VELGGEGAGESLGARYTLAESLLLLGRKEEAEPHIRHILRRKPSDPRGQFDAGLLAVASGDWEAARAHLLKCLDSPSARQKCRVQLAAVCRRLGDPARSDEFQAEANSLPADADWADPIIDACFVRAVKKRSAFKVAEGLESQGRFAEAEKVASQLAERAPDDDVAQLLEGRLLAQMGDLSSAELALRRARRLAPQKTQSHYLLALVLLQQGQSWKRGGDGKRAESLFREAAALAREALAIKPDFGFAHMALGLSQKELGQAPEARASLEAAVRCSPEYAEMHLNLAELLDELKRPDEARERYRQALRLAAPGTPWRGKAEARLAELSKSQKPPGNN